MYILFSLLLLQVVFDASILVLQKIMPCSIEVRTGVLDFSNRVSIRFYYGCFFSLLVQNIHRVKANVNANCRWWNILVCSFGDLLVYLQPFTGWLVNWLTDWQTRILTAFFLFSTNLNAKWICLCLRTPHTTSWNGNECKATQAALIVLSLSLFVYFSSVFFAWLVQFLCLKLV